MRYNLCTIKLTLWFYKVQWFLVSSVLCNHHHLPLLFSWHKNKFMGTSLVGKWLRLHIPNSWGAWVWFLVGKLDPTCHNQDQCQEKKTSGIIRRSIQQQHCCYVRSVVSDSLWLHRLQPTRLLCPWDYPCKHTREGCHFLPQGQSIVFRSKVIWYSLNS